MIQQNSKEQNLVQGTSSSLHQRTKVHCLHSVHMSKPDKETNVSNSTSYDEKTNERPYSVK